MPVTQDRWINKVLGGTRYVISEKLGEGGMGAVYLAEDRQVGTIEFAPGEAAKTISWQTPAIRLSNRTNDSGWRRILEACWRRELGFCPAIGEVVV